MKIGIPLRMRGFNMALSIVVPNSNIISLGNGFLTIAMVTFDSSYATGGESWIDNDFKLKKVLFLFPCPSSGYIIETDLTNKKLLVFYMASHRHNFIVQAAGTIGTSMNIGLSADVDTATLEGDVGITALRTLSTTSPVALSTSTPQSQVSNGTNLSTLKTQVLAIGY